MIFLFCFLIKAEELNSPNSISSAVGVIIVVTENSRAHSHAQPSTEAV